MLAMNLCHSEDIFARQSELESPDFDYNADEKDSEFSVFRDYLGLVNHIITSTSKDSSVKSTPVDSPCESIESISTLFEYPSLHRHRIDSLDSDAISDSSSSGGSSRCIDNEVSDNLNDCLPFARQPTTPLPTPLLLPDNIFTQTLESLIASQANAVNRHFQIQQKKLQNITNATSKAAVCVFCRNNGESREFYSSHALKDNMGNTTCPILRAYTCPLCKAHGNQAHTIKYCPKYSAKPKSESKLLAGLGLV